MSKLIDDLIKGSTGDPTSPFNTNGRIKWYLTKPLPFYSIGAFFGRVKDAYRVLTDKSRAYHYKEDEV